MTNLEKKNLFLNLRSLDALRGLLATYVLLGHCRWLLWAGNSDWGQHSHSWWSSFLAYASASLRYGHEAVIIFFVLSGFFIHLRASKQLAKSQTFQFNVINFFQRRCHRLVPPYIFALTLTAILDVAGRSLYPTLYCGLTGDPLLDQSFLKKDFSVASILPAIFMLPSSFGKDFGTNGPLWSLAYEVIYYLLYPLWLSFRRLGALPAYFAGVGFAVLANFFLPGFVSQVLIHYPIWLSGAAISEILAKKALPRRGILASSLFLLVAFITVHFTLPLSFTILFHALIGSSVVLIAVSLPLSVCKHNIHKMFEAIGIESYTIYIFHFPIVALISAWRVEVFSKRPLHGWLAIGGALITLLFCHLCFLLCERHFLHSRLKLNA